MSAFADSSALVKLYVDEDDSDAVLYFSALAVSCVARVEVPAALWRKHRLGELDATTTRVFLDNFEADFFGDELMPSRFSVLGLSEDVLDEAARLVAVHPLRAYDALQLASALAARAADPDCTGFACFDSALRTAATVEGLAVVP